MLKADNEIKITLMSHSSNEAFARVAVSSFASQLDPTLEEISDLKTAVSEAVTNCIVHAYHDTIGPIYITVGLYGGKRIKVKIRDTGCGIENIDKAMEPLYTTGGVERAGLGFSVMQSFTDRLRVRSTAGKGTTVIMEKVMRGRECDV